MASSSVPQGTVAPFIKVRDGVRPGHGPADGLWAGQCCSRRGSARSARSRGLCVLFPQELEGECHAFSLYARVGSPAPVGCGECVAFFP
jgi:hypothetical protein